MGKYPVRGFLCLAALLLLSSCVSIPDSISPEWTEAMFFKNAQEAMDTDMYSTALHYYEVYLIRYPENYQRAIAAEYERAFIYYKMGDYDSAGKAYQSIIAKYKESPYAMLYHPRFRYLSEMGLEMIEKREFVDKRLFWRLREKAWAKRTGSRLTDTVDDPLEPSSS